MNLQQISRKSFQRWLLITAILTLLPFAILKAPWPAIMRGKVAYLLHLHPLLLQAHLGPPNEIHSYDGVTAYRYYVLSGIYGKDPYRISLYTRSDDINDIFRITNCRRHSHSTYYDSDPSYNFSNKP